MHRLPASNALGFIAPPLEARVRDMMVDPDPEAGGYLALDFAQGGESRLLIRRRVQPREIACRG